jgi:hypothetical protein
VAEISRVATVCRAASVVESPEDNGVLDSRGPSSVGHRPGTVRSISAQVIMTSAVHRCHRNGVILTITGFTLVLWPGYVNVPESQENGCDKKAQLSRVFMTYFAPMGPVIRSVSGPWFGSAVSLAGIRLCTG